MGQFFSFVCEDRKLHNYIQILYQALAHGDLTTHAYVQQPSAVRSPD
jgi:hypothetical protein